MIWSFHSSENVDCGVLGCDAVLIITSILDEHVAHFYPEGRGSMFLWIVGNHLYCDTDQKAMIQKHKWK
jgi:hypothetical protein